MNIEANQSIINEHYINNKKEYMTRNKAGAKTKISGKYVIITNGLYQNALGLCQTGNAYLLPLNNISDSENSSVKVDLTKGTPYINNLPASVSKMKCISSDTVLEGSDIQLLRMLYGIILENMGKENHYYKATVYLPELFKAMGRDYDKERFTESLERLKYVCGVINDSVYSVFCETDFDANTKTLSFISPYMQKVIRLFLEKSNNPNRNDSVSNRNNPVPVYSWLIKPSICGERNHVAVEIVHIIVTLIEQAGKKGAHMSAKTIISHIPSFEKALGKATPSDKNKLLMRAFSKAWEILRTQTKLEEYYPGIMLPETNEVPTMSKIDMVFNFYHTGKRKLDAKETRAP